MMPLQRACGAENQVRNKLSNGPWRVQSKVYVMCTEYSATCGIRQLPGICWYPEKVHNIQLLVNCCESRWHRG